MRVRRSILRWVHLVSSISTLVHVYSPFEETTTGDGFVPSNGVTSLFTAAA